MFTPTTSMQITGTMMWIQEFSKTIMNLLECQLLCEIGPDQELLRSKAQSLDQFPIHISITLCYEIFYTNKETLLNVTSTEKTFRVLVTDNCQDGVITELCECISLTELCN